MDYNLLKVFNSVAKLGSLSKAASVLRMPKSKVSRDLSTLESYFGQTLLVRGPKGSSLTVEGEKLYHETLKFTAQADEISELFAHKDEALRGTIRISAPEDLSHILLHDVADEFQLRHPEVSIEVISSNNLLSFDEYNLDLAIRMGKLQDSSLVQKKVLDIDLIMVASEEYLNKYGTPKSLEDLDYHRYYAFCDLGGKIIFDEKIGKENLKSNSFMAIIQLIKAGKAISILPDFIIKNDKSNKLKPVLRDELVIKKKGYILSRPLKYLPKRVVMLKSFIEEHLK